MAGMCDYLGSAPRKREILIVRINFCFPTLRFVVMFVAAVFAVFFV